MVSLSNDRPGSWWSVVTVFDLSCPVMLRFEDFVLPPKGAPSCGLVVARRQPADLAACPPEDRRTLPSPTRHLTRPQRGSRLAFGAALCGVLGIAFGGCEHAAPPTAPTNTISKTGLGLPGNWVSTPRLFASGVSVADLAVTPGRAIASTRGPATSKLVTLGETGTMQPFAPGFFADEDVFCPLEVAPGIGDFPQGDIYVGRRSELWRLSTDGLSLALFGQLPSGAGDFVGLAFDPVGGFGYELVVLTDQGAVYRVNEYGAVAYIGSVGPGARGPSVAPASFGTFAGQLLVGVPALSELRAIDNCGRVSTVLLWSGVSGAFALPESPRAYGTSGYAAFFVTGDGRVFGYPLADLEGRRGQVLLTSLYRSGSGIAWAEPGGYRAQPFSRSMGPEVAAGIVHLPRVTLVDIEIFPGVSPKVMTLGSTVDVPAVVYGAVGFDPRILAGGEILLAGAVPVSKSPSVPGTFTDLNGDGRIDLLMRFRAAEMQLAPGQTEVELDCLSLAGERVQGTGHLDLLVP